MTTTLHPRLAERANLDALREAWRRTRWIRVEDALAPGLAEAIADAALEHRFEVFARHERDVRAFFFRQIHAYPQAGEAPSFGPIERVRDLLVRDVPALATAITGQRLDAIDNAGVAIDCYTRGSYLDAHTDQGPGRLVAFVVGLTRDRWSAEDGGWLERLAPDERTVIDRVPPGFGTIDLFTIHPLLRPHRVALLRTHVTRLSINGWLTGELVGPEEG
ncbi:MAG: 2OG-Fe(II) oxygenase [Deltaproteobacteria bacterium]|nr:2OG-Fe(II) oxygenase [Deltaproteobacteria bacterium]